MNYNVNDYNDFIELQKKRNLSASVLVVKELFPELTETIADLNKKFFSNYTIDAFVICSQELQAFCFPGKDNHISIALTSKIIELCSYSELRFVLGHELGPHIHSTADPVRPSVRERAVRHMLGSEGRYELGCADT